MKKQLTTAEVQFLVDYFPNTAHLMADPNNGSTEKWATFYPEDVANSYDFDFYISKAMYKKIFKK